MGNKLYNQILHYLRQHQAEFDQKRESYKIDPNDSYTDCYLSVEMADGSDFIYSGNCMSFAELAERMDSHNLPEVYNNNKPLEELEGEALVTFLYQVSLNQSSVAICEVNF